MSDERPPQVELDDPSTPPPCNQEVFSKGKSLLAADTSGCRAVGFEPWVQEVAKKSGQPVDWHYSGGVAHVLYLGDREKVIEAAKSIPCPANIMRWFEETDPGLYRKGVTPTPEGAIGAYYEGGRGSTYIVQEDDGEP